MLLILVSNALAVWSCEFDVKHRPAANWSAQAHPTSLPPPGTMTSTATSAQATLKLPSVSTDAGELARAALRSGSRGCRGRWPAEDGEGGGWSAGPGGSQAAALTSRNLARLGLGFVPGQRYIGSTPWIRKRRMREGLGGGLRREESLEPAEINR
jgi:hypothetical protein